MDEFGFWIIFPRIFRYSGCALIGTLLLSLIIDAIYHKRWRLEKPKQGMNQHLEMGNGMVGIAE